MAMLVVSAALICNPSFSGENHEETVKGPDQSAGLFQATAASGLSIQGSFSSKAANGSSCRKGKRFLGASPNFVARASTKVLANNCHDCCTENILFKDGFESHDTFEWSTSVGG